MNRSRVTGDLASQGNIFVDIANDRVGIGSTIPTQKLEVTGTVKATAFVGSGANLTGIDTDLVSDTSPQLGGNLASNDNNINIADSTDGSTNRITFGSAGDLQIYHDSSHSYIHDGGTGNLKVRSNNFRVSNADESKTSATFQPAGAVELYHNHSKKLETTSSGITLSDQLQANGTVFASVGLKINADSQKLRIGAGDDLELYHDGSNTLNIINSQNGNLRIQHGGTTKLQVLSSGIDVVGTVTADNQIVLNSGDSTPARIDLYCEVSNAHYTRLQAPAHSTYSGNVTVTIPNASGNLAVLANAANNRIVTATGTHGMTGESNLTYDGTNLQLITDANNEGIKLNSTASGGSSYPVFEMDANRSVGNTLGKIISKWNGTEVASIQITSGADGTNKDDAHMYFNTASAGTATEKLRIESTGNVIIAESMATNRPRIVLSAPNDGTNYNHLFGANLHVNSSGTFTTPTANISGGGWLYQSANSLNNHGHMIYMSAPDTNATSSTPLERLRITANGNVLIGNGTVTSQEGDGRLIVYANTRLHPAIKADCIDGGVNRANGYTLLADNYGGDESNINFGISYSGAGLVLSRGVKVSNTADDAYLSSMDSYAMKPAVFKLDDDGSFRFLNTNTSATTTTDSAVTLYERLRINSVGQISIRGTTTSFDTTGDLDSLQLYYETDSGQASIGPYSSGGTTHLSFYTNSGGNAATEKMVLGSSEGTMAVKTTSYPETTEYLTVFKAGVANGNRFKNRYIKIRNNFTGSAHGGVPIVWESNADGSNNKAYGAVVTESNGDIRFLNAAATSEKAIGTDLLSTISEKFRITTEGQVKLTGNNTGNHMSTFGGNVGGLTIDDVGGSHTGLEVSHGSNTVFLVASSNNSAYLSSYGTGNMIFELTGGGGTRERLRLTSDGSMKQTSTGYFQVAKGTTAQRPTGVVGMIRFNTSTDQLENFNATTGWVNVNTKIPQITSISGNIYNGFSTNLTINGTSFDATVTVTFKEGSTTRATLTNQSVSSGSVTVAVPSGVHGQSAGDTITITVTNTDGVVSAGSNKTIQTSPSGGSITTSGNFRIHTFTSSGNFVNTVGSLGVEYLVIAGGGAGGSAGSSVAGGGGGAGGYRSNVSGQSSGGGSSAESAMTLSAATFAVVVGAGAAAMPGTSDAGASRGSNSSFNSIVSTGGGGGGGNGNGSSQASGGSGGGGKESDGAGGSGTSGQGYDGGDGSEGNNAGGGGGGAGEEGNTDSFPSGGDGVSSNITGSAVTRAGGGGSGSTTGQYTFDTGGDGGGGRGSTAHDGSAPPENGTANTGGGGGGGFGISVGPSGAGGSGIVIIRYNTTTIS